MNNKPTVTIGIPAYNEEQNIKRLLTAILSQELRSVTLEKIIVVSDSSTDQTVAEVSSLNDTRVICLPNPSRLGQALSQNRILETNTSDILVLLNADVIIRNNFIEQISQPILHEQADLVAARIQPLPHQNFFEKIINFSVNQKNQLYESLDSGNNLYTCCGRGRAFSKKLAEKLRWPKLTSEDSYSYLFSVQNGFKYAYAREAIVCFRSPNNFKDHLKQSARFLSSKNEMHEYFIKSIINRSYNIPIKNFLQVFSSYLFSNPMAALSFIVIYISAIIFTHIKMYPANPQWSISTSTKVV